MYVVYIARVKRTQIYLDEDQKRALKMLAVDRDSNVSDLVREAIARLLRDELPKKTFQELRAETLAKLDGVVDDADVDAAFGRPRET